MEGRFPSNPQHVLSLKNVHPCRQDFYSSQSILVIVFSCILLYSRTVPFSSSLSFFFHVKNQKLPSGEMSLTPSPLPNLLALQLCSCAEKAAVLFLEPRWVKVSSGSLSGRPDAWAARAASLPSYPELFFHSDSRWELAGEKL